MSLPDARGRGAARIRRMSFPVLALLMLGACGFEPLYGTRGSDGPGVRAAAIEIAPIKDRIGHVVRNHLIDSLTPDGQPARPDYRLAIAITRSTAPLMIQLDNSVPRFNLTLRATFSLSDRTGAVVYDGKAQAIGSYNVVDSEFATLAAEQDAAREAARSLSDEIRALVLVYFTR